jgi:hypothetical protein
MFAFNVDFLCMKMKSFCLFKTGGANNHIKQRDACFFARNAIGVTYYRPTAMLTSLIHDFLSLANKMPYWSGLSPILDGKSLAFNGLRRHFVTKQEMTLTIMDEGNSHRRLSFCKLIMYKNSLVVFKDCQLSRGCPKDLP